LFFIFTFGRKEIRGRKASFYNSREKDRIGRGTWTCHSGVQKFKIGK